MSEHQEPYAGPPLIRITFDEQGQAAIELLNVSTQQVVLAGSLLSQMGQHLLNRQLSNAENELWHRQTQERLLLEQVTQGLRREQR